MLRISIHTIIIFCCLSGHPSGAQTKPNVEIRMNHFVGTGKLVSGIIYKNSFGETYTIGRFKYYVSSIRFISAAGNLEFETGNQCFLVNDDDEQSKTISLEVPEGNYTAISFLLGVDSLHNVSGAQTGVLDPVNGMFWTWNTGYVIVKLEGKSPVSTLPGNLVEYHLGGYKGPDKANRRITLRFPKDNIEVTKKKSTVVEVKVDINSFFNGLNELPIKKYPACTTAGSLTRQYAENYATMFSITEENK